MTKKNDESRNGKTPIEIRTVEFVGPTLKDLKALPTDVQDDFATSLTAVQYGQEPLLKFKHLHVSKGSAIELIINGRPAYRVVYSTKTPGKVHVLYAGKKTAQGTDKKLMEAVEARLKSI